MRITSLQYVRKKLKKVKKGGLVTVICLTCMVTNVVVSMERFITLPLQLRIVYTSVAELGQCQCRERLEMTYNDVNI